MPVEQLAQFGKIMDLAIVGDDITAIVGGHGLDPGIREKFPSK